MRSDKQIFNNYLKLFSGDFLSKIISYLSLIIIVKYVDVKTFGQYSILLVVIGLSSLFVEYGLDAASIYLLSKYGDIRKTINSNFIIRSALFLISLLPLYFLLSIFFDSQIKVTYFGLIILSNLASVFSYDYIFRFYEKMQVIAKINVYSSLIFLISIFLVVVKVNNIYGVILCFAITRLSRIILSVYFYYKYVNSSDQLLAKDNFEIRELIKNATPIFISSIMIWVYYQSDILILEYFHGKREVGYYSAAYKFILLFATIQIIYNQSLFPSLTKLSETSMYTTKTFIEKYFNVFFYLTTPLFFISLYLSDWFIITLYGGLYYKSVFIFNLLLFSLVFVFNESITAPLMIASGRAKVHMFIVGLGAFVNISLNFCLIPALGMQGAAISTIIAEAVIFSAFAYCAHKFFRVDFVFFLKVFIAQLLLLTFFSFKYELL